MISYGFSLQGKSHIDKNTVCQDANKVGKLECGLYIGIVADGVGSAVRSDIGSKMAVESLFEYCDRTIKKNDTADEIATVLEEGYTYALREITDHALRQHQSLPDYDTTLSSAVYDGKKIVYGHAGDGGIVVKFTDGRSEAVTKRQKGADGISVRPLRAGKSSWEFGTVEDVSALLLVTDGMLDGVVQPNLINLPPDRMSMVKGNYQKDNIYITAAEFFMNPYAVYRNRSIKNPDEYMRHILTGNLDRKDQYIFLNCMASVYEKLLKHEDAVQATELLKEICFPIGAVKNVIDDKSVVVMINEKDKLQGQDLCYYAEPDWKEQRKLWERLMYGQTIPSKVEPLEEKIKQLAEVVDEQDYMERNNMKKWQIIVLASVASLCLLVGGGVLALTIFPRTEKSVRIATGNSTVTMTPNDDLYKNTVDGLNVTAPAITPVADNSTDYSSDVDNSDYSDADLSGEIYEDNEGGKVAESSRVKKVKVTVQSEVRVTVRWKKKMDISGYEVQYALDEEFNSAKTKKYSSEAVELRLPLQKNTPYYIRVRAVNNKSVGKWSVVRKIG